jgi:hypothetical protein
MNRLLLSPKVSLENLDLRLLQHAAFHFVCSTKTFDVLKQKFEEKPGGSPSLDFHGVQIFIDESVADGHVEKRQGRSPDET